MTLKAGEIVKGYGCDSGKEYIGSVVYPNDTFKGTPAIGLRIKERESIVYVNKDTAHLAYPISNQEALRFLNKK